MPRHRSGHACRALLITGSCSTLFRKWGNYQTSYHFQFPPKHLYKILDPFTVPRILLNIPFEVSKISCDFHIYLQRYFYLLCFALLETGRTLLFSLKTTDAPLLVCFCSASNHRERAPANSPRKEGVKRRRCGKKQVEAGRWSTLTSLFLWVVTHSHLKHSELSRTDSHCMMFAPLGFSFLNLT